MTEAFLCLRLMLTKGGGGGNGKGGEGDGEGRQGGVETPELWCMYLSAALRPLMDRWRDEDRGVDLRDRGLEKGAVA